MDSVGRKYVAKCPHCGQPHGYTEIRFNAVNDDGYWKLACQKCEKDFVIRLKNPRESWAPFYVAEQLEGPYTGNIADVATEIVQHKLPAKNTSHFFDYSAAPLYVCATSNSTLETLARDAMRRDLDGIKKAYLNAANRALASHTPPYRHLVAHVPFGGCNCGQDHIATFYAKFLFTGDVQNETDAYLLAGISGCDLEDRLSGLFSKTDIMALLEKLLIRWHLTADQILVAVPFVGHSYLPKEKKMAIWSWLLSLINPELGVFITRSKTFSDYKNVAEDVEGLHHGMLLEYGLAEKLIAADVRKQDFHAKFFIGINSRGCEVMSGSANIVTGPSIENIAFHSMDAARCTARYINPLKISLPPALERIPHVLASKVGASYQSVQSSAPPLAVNPVPPRSPD
jgi:hypothetical protein